MVTNKAITIGKDIDIARCKGNWSAIPELARRYKKHNPNGIALEQSVLAEHGLNEIIQKYRKESTLQYANDAPNVISLSARVDPNLMKPIQHQLSNALGDKDASTETTLLKQMSKILLARTYFESGEYNKAIEVLNEIDLRLFEQQTGYSYTLYSQALVIRAVSLELLNKVEDALKAYGDIVILVNAIANLVDRAMVDWIEEGLYRGVLFALSNRCHTIVDVPHKMRLVRAYQKTCSSQLVTWRIYKRLVVTKYSLRYLSTMYRQGRYVPPVPYSLTEEGRHINEEEFHDANRAYNHQLFSIEIMQLHTVYEKLVYSVTQFPTSGQSNSLILEFINCLASDFELVGGTETEKRGFVEVLHRASTKTFNSPCVTRHLFHALVNLGDYEQAEHALRTYLYLVGLESKSLMDSRSITPALASDSFGFNTPVPNANEIVENLAVAEEYPTKKLDIPQEVESTENKIHVLIVAVKMYCQDLCKGADAVAVAEMAEQVYNQQETNINGAEVYRTLGVAFGFLASQTFDQDRRPQYHEKALASLRRSLEMNNDSWETYYQTAFQLAEMRDIQSAIPMISQSLQLNSTYLPSWHLLCLLCTCPIKDNLKQALKTCDIAIQEASAVFKESWIDYSDDIAQHILLHKTHTLLVGRVKGADAAFMSQEALFQLFGKIVVPELIPDTTSSNMLHEAISNGNARYGMILSGSLGNMEPIHDPSTRHRSSSNASSTFTNGKTKSVSSFTGRKFHLAEMFHHHQQSDTRSVQSVPILKSNSSTLSRKKGSLTSLHSTSTQHTLLQTTATLTRPTTQARLQHQRSCKMLCELWLLSAEAFLNMGRLDEALKAVSEAENIDWTTHAGVWCVLGRIRIAQNQKEKAILAFQKGLVTKPNDVECRVWLAKTYIELGELEVAEGILEAVTRENGWDHPSAWFYLSEIYKQTDRLHRTKDCLFYALELESTRPIQPFTILPRFV